jgi:hypothetical protein
MSLIHDLGLEASGMLHYLINLESRVGSSDGWFYCTTERLVKETRMSPRTQRRVIKILEERKLVKTKKSGGPPAKRYIKINTKLVTETILSWRKDEDTVTSSGDENVTTGDDETVSTGCDENVTSLYSNKKSNNNRVSKKNSFTKGKRAARKSGHLISSDDDDKNAALLRSILMKHGSPLIDPAILSRNGRKPVGLARLANGFYRLRIDLGVSEQEISRFLEWYEIHYMDEFVPKLYKADDLITKWPKLKDAMRRDDAVSGNGKKNSMKETISGLREEMRNG